MDPLPTREVGHALVAAVRVLQFRDGRAPTDEDVADLLGMPTEEALLWVRGLERHGVVQLVKSPFDQRIDIVDHTRLDTLAATHDPDQLKSELDAFHERNEAAQEQLDKLLGEDPNKKVKERASQLAKELERFKAGGRVRSPFEKDDDD